jgi:hypothetical protein
MEKKIRVQFFCRCLYIGQTASSEGITEIGPMLAGRPTLGYRHHGPYFDNGSWPWVLPNTYYCDIQLH